MFAAISLLTAACSPPPSTAAHDTSSGSPGRPACNGAAALCARRFDEVSYPTTHNAMASAEDRWLAPNQEHAIPRQLRDGVRALMLDLHYELGQVKLCHGYCGLGRKPLVEALREIRDFMEDHPREVVTLIFESYVSARDVAAAFEASGLLHFAHVQLAGAPWPTLERMIAEDRRLVVLTDRGGGVTAYPWYHAVWDHAWDTPWSFKTTADFSCERNRGDHDNPLFILNHFLTDPIALRDLARQVNHNPLLLDRARRCHEVNGRLPNFVTVDFYATGDLFAAVAVLNRVE